MQEKKLFSKTFRDIAILTGIALVYFILLKLKQFYAFGTATDIVFYDTLFHNTINGKIMWSNSTGTVFFEEHFTPFLFLLVPFYYLFQSPLTLLIIQAVGVSIAMIPLYLLSMHLAGSRLFSITLCLAYFLSRTVNYALMFDFHQEVFYPFLFLFLLYAFTKKQWTVFYVFVLLCISIKEDANIALIGVGLYLLFKKQYRHGAATILISVTALLVTFIFILPAYRDPLADYKFVGFWADYGSTTGEILLNMLNPIHNFQVLFKPEKISNMFNLFSVYLFLPLGSPWEFFFLVLPAWFMLFSSSNPLIYGQVLYYGMLITPFLMYSTITTVTKLKAKWKRSVVIVSVLLLLVNLGNSRIFKQLFQESWEIPARYETAIVMINSIPPEAPVTAQLNLLARIPVRDRREIMPNALDEVQYVMFDLKGDTYPLDAAGNMRVLDSLRNSGGWNVQSEKDDFVLLKKK